jgi:hypothetical protein
MEISNCILILLVIKFLWKICTVSCCLPMNTSGYIVRIMHTNRQLIRKKGRFYDSCNTVLNRFWNGLGISGSICSLLICLSAQLSSFVRISVAYVVISPLNKTQYFRHKYFLHMHATCHGITLYSVVGTFCCL